MRSCGSMCAICTGDQEPHPWFRCAHASHVVIKRNTAQSTQVLSSGTNQAQTHPSKPPTTTSDSERKGRLAGCSDPHPCLHSSPASAVHEVSPPNRFSLHQQRHDPRLLLGTVFFEALVVAVILHDRLRNFTRAVLVG